MQNQKHISGKTVLLHTVTAILISFLFLLNVNAQETPKEQRDALIALFKATSGEDIGWRYDYGWGDTLIPVREWAGVTCDDSGNVTKLYLRMNGLRGEIPPEIGALNELIELDMAINDITKIPIEFGGLTTLKFLKLSQNDITNLPDGIFNNLTNLLRFEFSMNPLESIPSDFGGMINLTHLWIELHENTTFPTEICELTELTFLSYQGIKTAKIPGEIRNLTNLKTLYLYAFLTEFPSELISLPVLSTFMLNAYGQLQSVPPEIENMNMLRHLGLSNTQLSQLPQEFSSLNLRSVAFGSGHFSVFPGELFGMNLRQISITDNQLTEIPSEIGNEYYLESLVLQNNNLTKIPQELGDLPFLESLNLRNNQLSGCFHPNLKSLCGRQWIYFEGNPDLPDFNAFCSDGTGECPPCEISEIIKSIQTPCQSIDNTYTQELTVSFIDPPEDGFLVVNGQQFPIETSPQTITLTGLAADEQAVDVNAYFSSNTDCSYYSEALFTAPPACHTPVAECAPATVYADNSCTAMASIDAGSYDQDEGDILTITQDPPGPYSLGETLVTLTVSDGSSFDTCSSVVTVVDNSLPIPDVNPLPDLFGECSVAVDVIPTATDNCSGVITGSTLAPLFYPDQGEYFIDWSFEDAFGNTLTQQQKVIVKDITPPVLVAKAPPVEVFEKSIHQEVTYTLDQLIESVSDNCTNLTLDDITIIQVESDEDEDGDMPEVNDGSTSDDIVIEDGCQSVTLMAECDLNSNGRVYTIYFEVNDYNGNSTVACTEVHVIHKDIVSAVNDGPFYIINNCGKPDKMKSVESIEISDELSITNYPNPFNGKTTIEFSLPEKGNVNIVLYDNTGKVVSPILDQEKSAGKHTIEFDGTGFSQGIYFYTLMYNNTTITKKMVLQN